MTTVLLFSGGLDSLCAWHLLGRPVAVYVTLGHPYQADELHAMGRLAEQRPALRLHAVPGPDLGALQQPDGHLPHRNLILAAVAAAHCPTADRVALGALLGEASPDKSRRFLRAASRVLSVSEVRRVRVTAPFRHLTKTGLLRAYLRAGGDPQLVALTRSCYEAGDTPYGCGRCQACFRRWVALYRCGLDAGPRPALTVDRGDVLRHWRRAGLRATPGLVVNNAGALLALRRAERTG